MKITDVPPRIAGNSRQIPISDENALSEIATILAGLERQKEELGPIAEELIELLHHLGVGTPPQPAVNPSSE